MLARFIGTVCLLVLPSLLFSQEFRATLAGHVSDQSGAAVAGAKVQVKSVDTGSVSVASTDENGDYQAAFLNPGPYTITVERAGFQRSVQDGLQLQVAEKAQLNIVLTVGDVNQSVEVSATPSLVDAESADKGLTIGTKRIEDTPLQGRNIFAQAWSAPGVAVTASAQRLRPFDVGGSSSMAINGGVPSGNEVLIDGVSNLAQAQSVAYVPPVEATEEFRVQTTNMDAQYGWTTGGVINIITKSGTNQWHGSLFEFLQNTHLNANTFDNNLNGIPRQSAHINTFGGAGGGPIRKNKLFSFFSYENIRQVIPDPFVTSVPTALQRAGDFSQTYYAGGQQQTLYDPFTTRTGPTGALIRDAFPGNMIPANRINPVAAKVLSLIPLGNVPGNGVTGLNNLVNNGSTRKFTDFFPEYTGRVDYNISDATQLFVRYSRNALAEERSFHYSTNSQLNVAETSGNAPFTRENHSATVQVTHTLNPSTVVNARFGLARFLSQQNSSNIGANYDLANLGFSPQFVGLAASYFPRFNWTNYEGAGSAPLSISPIAQTNSFQGSIYKTAGRQTIKTGGEFRLQRVYQKTPGYTAGNFTFDQAFTGANPLQIAPSSGNSIASFLLGTPASGFIDVNSQPARQQRLFSLYVQDDIRVTDRLKLNLGLRWDYLGPLTDRFNALNRGFDAQAAIPLKVPGLNLKGGLLFAGVNGNPRGIYDSDWNNFGPRIGFAYRVNGKTVVRGGYALFYAQTFDDPGNAPGFSQRTQMVTSIAAGVPANPLVNPFPTGFLQPVGSSLGLATALGQSFQFADPARVVPWTHQFSAEIQRELPFGLLLSIGYVGSRVNGLSVTQQINEIPASAFGLGAAALTASVPNPLAGSLPGTSLNGGTVQQQQLLRPFPQFLSIAEVSRSRGQSHYDGGQALLVKRFAAGLQASVADTYSKTTLRNSYTTPQETILEKVLAPYDVTNSLQLNSVYELPFGRGKTFGSAAPSILRHVISGWEISGIARIQSGLPMNFPAGAAATGVSPVLSDPTLSRWFNTCTLLPSGKTQNCLTGEQPVWTIRQPFTLQTWSSRISSVRLPAVRNLDAALIKNNRIGERFDLIFRADFLNATNTVQFFNGPITDVNNGNFGRISGAVSQSNLPRVIQLSLKLRF